MATLMEVHIGTKFKTKDFTNPGDAINRGYDSLRVLANLLSEVVEDDEFLKNPQGCPSKRNDILFKCADVVIDYAQAMESTIGERPNPTIHFILEDIEDEFSMMKNLDAKYAVGIVLVSILKRKGNKEYVREKVTNICLPPIKTACALACGITDEIDLEPYILQRVSERS